MTPSHPRDGPMYRSFTRKSVNDTHMWTFLTTVPPTFVTVSPSISFRLTTTFPCHGILKVVYMCMSNAMNMDVTSFFGAWSPACPLATPPHPRPSRHKTPLLNEHSDREDAPSAVAPLHQHRGMASVWQATVSIDMFVDEQRHSNTEGNAFYSGYAEKRSSRLPHVMDRNSLESPNGNDLTLTSSSRDSQGSKMEP
ncbi:hypothetical protein NQZ68_022623 [Dissostichus eleginoides]|nr:hypothetical protein NQZ68_022623 [Dissostichus eleginoides]